MSPLQLAASLALSLSLVAGQLLFKLAAEDMKIKSATSWLLAATSPWLIASIALYGASTALWLGILANAPLSKAYPFALAGAALVPVASWLILREPLSPQIAIGMALVIAGLAVIQFG